MAENVKLSKWGREKLGRMQQHQDPLSGPEAMFESNLPELPPFTKHKNIVTPPYVMVALRICIIKLPAFSNALTCAGPYLLYGIKEQSRRTRLAQDMHCEWYYSICQNHKTTKHHKPPGLTVPAWGTAPLNNINRGMITCFSHLPSASSRQHSCQGRTLT